MNFNGETMKPFCFSSLYLNSFLLLCLCQPASAQVLDHLQLDKQLDGVTRELEDITGRVQEQVRNQDLLPPSQLDEALAKPVADVLGVVPDTLANVLPIVTRTGDIAFVEVKVEQDWRAIEREWLIVLDENARADFAALEAEIIEQTQFADLGLQLVRFRVPAVLDSLAALKKRLPERLHNQLDRNHIYIPQAQSHSPQLNVSDLNAQQSATDLAASHHACNDAVSIGMIDTAINTRHPAFAGSKITINDFAGENFDAPRAHGTAVAGLLVGHSEQLTPLLPGATLFAASVFYPRNEYTQGATMMNLVRALNWLAANKIRVINMSLAGPDNKILGIVVNKIIASGVVIIAAAGNEGPAAPAVYPAAYENVIAVTAVDKQQRSYRWANRGEYIDFAAPGVGIYTARSSGDFGRETGTSMAAPVVSALIACELEKQKKLTGEKTIAVHVIIEQLIKKSIDLGDQGRDPVFGFGLVGVH